MDVALLRILRIVVRSDSDPARQVLFGNLQHAKRSVRLVVGLHAMLARLGVSAWLVCGYGLAAFLTIAPPRRTDARVIAVAQYANARRQVARLLAWINPMPGGLVRTGARVLASPWGLLSVGALVRARLGPACRVARRLDHRHGFLVACRGVAAIAWYARGLTMLRRRTPGAVLVSGDTHPEDLGLAGAARTLGIPQVFISHAYPTPYAPRLRFSLSILEGEAAAEARRRAGPIEGAVLLAGLEGDSVPLDATRFRRSGPVIGVFTPKAISWPALAAIIRDCRTRFAPKTVFVRWHPSMFETPHLSSVVADLDGVVATSGDLPLADIARRCDWVIADENSNVHLPVLKLGIPTVAVRHMGLYPDSRADQYGFAASGVIPPALRSVAEMQVDAVESFYADGWAARFRRYDAAYLLPPETVAREVRHAVGTLLEAGGGGERA